MRSQSMLPGLAAVAERLAERAVGSGRLTVAKATRNGRGTGTDNDTGGGGHSGGGILSDTAGAV